uniref:Uncharacterized protein n=1 Tax=Romanomermis culicivorax TaxID=13658 RepID=A0A915IPG0_ROMCU
MNFELKRSQITQPIKNLDSSKSKTFYYCPALNLYIWHARTPIHIDKILLVMSSTHLPKKIVQNPPAKKPNSQTAFKNETFDTCFMTIKIAVPELQRDALQYKNDTYQSTQLSNLRIEFYALSPSDIR